VIITGGSEGVGAAAARLFAAAGANLLLVARGKKKLEAIAEELREVTQVEIFAMDVSDANACADLFKKANFDFGQVDILVNNAGGPPPGDFRDWDREDWLSALNANMLTPIELIKATVDAMGERGYGRIVNITSSSVKSPIPTLGLSNGARAGLTGFVAGVARQVVAKGVTINGILPGPFDTDRLRSGIRYIAEQSGRDFEEEFEQACVAIANRLFTATPGPAKGLLTGAGCDALRVRPGQTRPGLGRIQPKQNVQIAPFELVGPMAMELRVEGIDEPLARGFPIVRLRPRRPERR